MRITLINIILFALSTIARSQSNKSMFTLKNMQIAVPAFLPGIMDDPSIYVSNDTLHYNLQGQYFMNAPLTIDNLPLPYPWRVINEMVDAYKEENRTKIEALYDTRSKQKIAELLTGNHAKEMMNYVQNAAVSNLRILAGIGYKNGLMVYTKDDTYGLHENFIVIENGKYKLSALEDSSALLWNIGLYFKFEPKNLSAIDINIPDSLNINHIKQITVHLEEPNHWIAVYSGEPGEPVQLLVQDNGINDLDPDPLKVKFNLAGRMFLNKGEKTFYIGTSNYPIQTISAQLFLPELKRKIIIF